MKLEYKTCVFAALFLGVVAIVYWLWSREQTGTTCLVFGLAAYLMLGTYLFMQWRRRHGVPRPEDAEYAEQADGAGEIGYFPAASVWPAGMGLGGVFLGIGLIYGVWYFVLGGIFMLGSIIGYVVEAEAREEGTEDPGVPVDPHDTGAPMTSDDVPTPHSL